MALIVELKGLELLKVFAIIIIIDVIKIKWVRV